MVSKNVILVVSAVLAAGIAGVVLYLVKFKSSSGPGIKADANAPITLSKTEGAGTSTYVFQEKKDDGSWIFSERRTGRTMVYQPKAKSIQIFRSSAMQTLVWNYGTEPGTLTQGGKVVAQST